MLKRLCLAAESPIAISVEVPIIAREGYTFGASEMTGLVSSARLDCNVTFVRAIITPPTCLMLAGCKERSLDGSSKSLPGLPQPGGENQEALAEWMQFLYSELRRLAS